MAVKYHANGSGWESSKETLPYWKRRIAQGLCRRCAAPSPNYHHCLACRRVFAERWSKSKRSERGQVLKTALTFLVGCADPHMERLFGDQCHYPQGEAVITVRDPLGLRPEMGGVRDLPAATTADCEQHASFADGVELDLHCRDGSPVEFCSVTGDCFDYDSGYMFWCEGEVTFR